MPLEWSGNTTKSTSPTAPRSHPPTASESAAAGNLEPQIKIHRIYSTNPRMAEGVHQVHKASTRGDEETYRSPQALIGDGHSPAVSE